MNLYIMELVEKWLTRNEIAIPKVALSAKYNAAGDDVEVWADSASSSLQAISFSHHKVHVGDAYFYSDVDDLSINNVRDLRIITPDTGEWGHFVFEVCCESETEVYLYENCSIDVSSTPATLFNANRNSANAAGLEVQPILNTSVANANSDTDVSGALELLNLVIVAGGVGGLGDHKNEIVLKQNEDYCLRIIATAAGNVSYRLRWYEHEDHD